MQHGVEHSMIQQFTILLISAAVTIAAVRFLLLCGIDTLATSFRLSSKIKGQIIGYTTSLPEFVVVVAAAVSGVFEAGFWNIASSNIINMVLCFSAILYYKQHGDLRHPTFIDELIFSPLSVAIPLVLFLTKVDLTVSIAIGLFIVFLVYKYLDNKLNANPTRPAESSEPVTKKAIGIAFVQIVVGIALVIVAGDFLGDSTKILIVRLGTPSWLIGWILGFMTSLPEMTSFFEIYRTAESKNLLHLPDNTQEALDALVASNMSNLGIILPLGMLLFAIFAG